MKKLIPILVVFNFLVSLCFSGLNVSASSSTSSMINVKLSAFLGNQSSINISITGNYKVVEDGLDLSGSNVVKVESGQLVLYKDGIKVKNYGSTFTATPVVYNTENIIAINGRKYLGTMKFEVENGKDGVYVRPYNTLPVEDYLKGVVSQEMSPSWGDNGGMEALKAQAIAARTYAQGVNPIDDGQTDQVYLGYYWYKNTNQAVEATQGMVLKYDGKVIGANAFYSSSNGGRTLSKVNSWGDASWNHVPYLQVKEDPYDTRSSNSGNENVNWSFSITKNQIDLTGLDLSQPAVWWNEKREISADIPILSNIKNWLQTNSYVDKKYEIKIVSIPQLLFDINVPASQTINGQITIDYMLRDKATNKQVMENGQIKIFSNTINKRAYDLRSMIGSTIMKSPYIKSVQDNGTRTIINGGGWGHGIGMSQFGAFQMSKEGRSFKEILNFYYPGTTIEDVLGPTLSNLKITVDDDQVVTFSYNLDEDSTTTVTLNSPQKSILSSTYQPKGSAQFTWDASSLSSGDYSVTLVTNDGNGNTTQSTGELTISDATIMRLTLYEPTNLYQSPTTDQAPDVIIGAQIVNVVEQQGEWFKIKTWLGDKWIKPGLYSIPTEKELNVTKRTNLYNEPLVTEGAVSFIDPQKVSVVAEIPGTGWVQIKTWLGPKWLEVKIEEEPKEDNSSNVTIMKLTLYEPTNLYKSATTDQAPDVIIGAQIVNVVEQQGEWFKIKTWLGDKWIKPGLYSIPTEKELNVTKRTNLYNEPLVTEGAVSFIDPQKVSVVAEIPGTGWVQIKTWLGPKWLEVKIEEEPKEDNSSNVTIMKLTLYEPTNLYKSATTDQAPDVIIGAQIVNVVEQQGEWFKIKTWLGDKWIKPGLYSIPTEKELNVTKRTNLYNEPLVTEGAVSFIDPQKVSVVAEIPGTGWVQIKTWLGPKWLEVKIEEEPKEDNSSNVTIMKLTLYEPTNLYKSSTTDQAPDVIIGAQIVNVVEQQGEWFKIKTWLGDKWIKPGLYSIPTEKEHYVTKRTNLYDEPLVSEGAVSFIDPQKVSVIAEIPGTGWVQIKTWLGPKWIYIE